ncbi:hypothetical protein PS1_000707 [Malus domestica]
MTSCIDSFSEYIDLKTLWDQTHDAINTIIRRDETFKTGEFLQPCIEGATTIFGLHNFLILKKVQLGGKQPSGLFLASISILLSEQVPFAENDLVVSNIVSDSKHILVGLYNGGLYSISWKGEFYGTFELDPFPRNGSEVIPSPHSLDNGVASKGVLGTICISWKSAIIQLELCFPLRLLFVLYSDGQLVSCSISKKGLKHVESIKAEKRLAVGDAVCASVASEHQILAVGTKRGLVKLYDLAESASLIRSVSLYDWG